MRLVITLSRLNIEHKTGGPEKEYLLGHLEKVKISCNERR